jgi:hypothetical protein
MKKRGCGCALKIVDGRAGGVTCEHAKFKAWKPREIARLAQRHVFDPQQFAAIAREVIGADMTEKEHILFVGVNGRNQVIGIGDGASTEKHLCAFRLLDAVAAMLGSASKPGDIAAVFMAHNHPSGTPYASEDDVRTTKNVLEKFRLVPVVDHGIVYLDAAGRPGLYSFRDEHPDLFLGTPSQGFVMGRVEGVSPAAKAQGAALGPVETRIAAVPAKFRVDARRVYDWLAAKLVEDDQRELSRWGKRLSPRYGYSGADIAQSRGMDLSTRRIDAVLWHLERAGLVEMVSREVVPTEHRARMGTRFGAPKKTVHGEYADVRFRPVFFAPFG